MGGGGGVWKVRLSFLGKDRARDKNTLHPQGGKYSTVKGTFSEKELIKKKGRKE